MDANCKYCGGTGKIQLLHSEVPCDCVSPDPVINIMMPLPVDPNKLWHNPPGTNLGASLMHKPHGAVGYKAQWDCHNKPLPPSCAEPTTMDVWLWHDSNGTIRWVEAPEKIIGLMLLRDFSIEISYIFRKNEIDISTCFIDDTDMTRKGALELCVKTWFDGLVCSPGDVDFQDLYDALVVI